MKSRFPHNHRITWRQRFVAISRQADAARRMVAPDSDVAPRRPGDGSARAEIRVRFAAITSH